MRTVTLEMVAKAAGVHGTTVGRALRNHPGIPPETRERIRKIAEQMGYRPNPLVSIYQAYVRGRRKPPYQANIAWIDDQESGRDWLEKPWLRGYLRGAERRAQELGYRIERVRLEEFVEFQPDVNVQRFCRILEARGIFGAILPLLRHPSLSTGLWTTAVVEIGRYEAWLTHARQRRYPPRTWNAVLANSFMNVQTAFLALLQRGYQRPGLLVSAWYDRAEGLVPRGAFLAEQWELPPSRRVPPLFFEDLEAAAERQLPAWLRRWSPDAVICADSRVRGVLERLGYHVPQDLGLAHLNVAEDVKGWSGIDEQHEFIGAAAVDMVVAQLEHNERGLPANPRSVLIDGRWVDGETTPGPK
ncbi:MAG: LacI family transcriptional regulator [Verrucomicrobiae bacterium]|nr:LacI family transcriptional regulator [Verrucomicrobiae bacterium]